MAENTAKKTSPWTEGENAAFMRAIIDQLLAKNKDLSIDFKSIAIPGRTPRALQERWSTIKKGVAAAGIIGSGPAGTPQKRTPRAKAKVVGNGETPTKKRKRAPKSEVKVEDEDEEGMPVLQNNDTSDNEGAVGGKAVKEGVPA